MFDPILNAKINKHIENCGSSAGGGASVVNLADYGITILKIAEAIMGSKAVDVESTAEKVAELNAHILAGAKFILDESNGTRYVLVKFAETDADGMVGFSFGFLTDEGIKSVALITMDEMITIIAA